jgi:putative N6-adenine-specific DNA methylase
MITTNDEFEIFLVVPPGLEAALREEARACGFKKATITRGGVTVRGGWPEVWRANLELRGATRVIAPMAAFRASHLSELDKRARKVSWGNTLRRDRPFRVEASCKSSKIYHSGAAEQRIERAIREELGASFDPEAEVCVRARIENDMCAIGVDTSGDLLHKRGHKQAVSKAPMRETLAALFLQLCGYDGRETVVDPMCGSGTFVIEAAEIAARLMPGRSRHFAFEELANFDADVWKRLRDRRPPITPPVRFYGSDRDAGAIRMSRANAERAGVSDVTEFERNEISDLAVPEGSPGLVIVNAPYGDRVGEKNSLDPLYRTMGRVLHERFAGWRVGLITNDARLASATRLPFSHPLGPISHGGLRIALYLTGPLKS